MRDESIANHSEARIQRALDHSMYDHHIQTIIVHWSNSSTKPWIRVCETHFFKRDPISNKGDKDEILGDGTDIHHGSSEESNQDL